MGTNDSIEIKQFEKCSQLLKNFVTRANEDGNDHLDTKELSIFRGYVNDAEYNKQLSDDDKSALKSIMGYTPVAYSMDTKVKAPAVEQKQADEKTPYQEVREAFDKARGYDPKTNTYAKTIDQAYKAVKKDDAFKDKKYKAALKQLKYDRKHSIADAEAQEVRRKATLAVDDQLNIVNENALKLQDDDDVRDAQLDYIRMQNGGTVNKKGKIKGGKIDKRVKKALRNKNQSAAKNFGLWFSGNYSAGKQDDISVAHLNKAAEIANKTYGKDEVVKIVGSEERLNDFIAAGLVKYDESTKTYNIKDLSLLYFHSIGADATINEHDVNVESEIQAFRTKLHIASGFDNDTQKFKLDTEDMSKKEILDLGKNLGFYDNHYHGKFVRTWQKATQGLAKGAIIGAAAGARKTETNVNLEQHQKVSIELEGFSDEERAKVLSGISTDTALTNEPVTVITSDGTTQTTFGQIAETAMGIYITQDQMMNVHLSSLWKHVALGAAIGGAVGTGMGIIEGLVSKGREKECFGLAANCNDIQTYEQMVSVIDHAYPNADLKPEQKEALKKVALLGYQTEWVTDEKTGKQYERFVMDKDCKRVWDWCTFLKNYNNYRGNQIFNANELRMASLLTQNRLKEVKTEDCATKKPEVTPAPAPAQTPSGCTDCNEKPATKDVKIPPHAWKREGGETWGAIVKAKYPCLVEELAKKGIDVYDKNGAIKVMQRALATDEDGEFHADKFREITSGDIPARLDFPDEIQVTVDGKTVTCKYEDNPVKKKSQAELNRGGSARSNNGRYGYGRKGKVHTFTNDCYPAIVGEGSTPEEAKADFDDKVKKMLKEKNKN